MAVYAGDAGRPMAQHPRLLARADTISLASSTAAAGATRVAATHRPTLVTGASLTAPVSAADAATARATPRFAPPARRHTVALSEVKETDAAPQLSRPFIVGEPIQLWSVTYQMYVSTKIAAVNAADGSVQVECKPGVWIERAEQASRIKRSTDQAIKPFFVGEYITWTSATQGKTFVTKVTAVNSENGCIQVEVKPNVWVDRAEQALKIARLHQFDKDEVKNLSDLDQAARNYFNVLQNAANPGGEDEMNRLMNEHLQGFDKDKDGQLTKSEFMDLYRHICSRLRMQPDEEKIAALVPGNVLSDAEYRETHARLIKLILSSFKLLGKDDLLRAARVANQEFKKKYNLGKRLAAGAGGVTYLATRVGITPPQYVVVKKPNVVTSREDFDLLKDKAHPNVLKVFEIFQTPRETHIVMEYCPGGDLFGGVQHCFKNFGAVTLNWVANVMQQSMRGVKYLHSEFKQCHNDLKPENILLDRKPSSMNDCPRIMIADFGCVSDVNAKATGDPRYQPPERWLGNFETPGTYACDVWALGVILFELISGGMLIFTNHSNVCGFAAWKATNGGELVHRLRQGMLTPSAEPDWTQIPAACPATSLCKAMLTKDFSKRIVLDDAMRHGWFDMIAEDPVQLDAGVARHLKKRATLSTLKVALLNMVAQKLQNDSLETYHRLWKQFDHDENGVLSMDEFDRMLQSPDLGLDAATALELHVMADIDGNGHVDFNEFVALMFNPQAMTSADLEQVFKSIFNDLAGTKGELSKDELAAAFPSQAQTLIPQLFEKMDNDGNGAVSFSEFSDFLSSM